MAAIVYFSRAEENLINGTYQLLTKGNTQIVAEKIALKVNGQIYGVETIDPYPSSYPEAVAKAKLEKEKAYCLASKQSHLVFSQNPSYF